MFDSFEFKTESGLQFTVIAEDFESVDELKQLFQEGAAKKPQRSSSYAKKIGTGLTHVIAAPWNITKVMVYSLEKVMFKYLSSIDWRWN